MAGNCTSTYFEIRPALTALEDGHIDLPELYRSNFANNVTGVDLNEPTLGEVDIPRLREGKVGAFWWSAWVDCPGDWRVPDQRDENFLNPNWRVRDTLEQIDVAKLAMELHSQVRQKSLAWSHCLICG